MPSIRKIRFREVLLSLVILTMTASASFAADISVNLTAMQTTMTMPGGEIVTVWVFAQDGVLGDPALPGPVIQAQAGDNLTINLTNQLSVPVSMYINGQRKAMDPVWTEGTAEAPIYTTFRPADNYTARVRSFDTETAPLATVAYTWTNIKAGTYMYQSGTDIAAQVPMGLFGVLKVDVTAGATAYPGVNYDEENIVVFSELDPTLNESIVSATYTSSVDYHPRYFLINGKPFVEPADAWIPATAGASVLLRIVNAGLETRAPVVPGVYMTLVAVDGYPLNNARSTYGTELSAGQTQDILITAADGIVKPFFDRRLYLSNNGSPSPGGAMTYLAFGAVATPCVGDFDFDGDVDGMDILAYVAAIPAVDAAAFAANLGLVTCTTLP